MNMRGWAVFVPMVALGACASIGGPGKSSYYDCGPDTRLKVDYIGAGVAQVQVNNDKPIVLSQEKAGSGAKFSSGPYSFWSRGDEATWTTGRMAPIQCRQVAMQR